MTGLPLSVRAALASIAAGALLAPALGTAESARTEPADGEEVSEVAPGDVLTLEETARLLRVDPEELADLATRQRIPGRKIGSDWRFSRGALQSWLAGVDIDSSEVAAVEDQALSSILGRGPDGSEDEEPTVGEEPRYETAEDIFLRRQRVLLGRGQVLLEPALFYSRGSYPALIGIDFIPPEGSNPLLVIHDTATIEQDTLTASLVTRYGLFKETELFGGILYEYQRNTYQNNERETDSVVDVVLGARRTLTKERRLVPGMLLSAHGRFPALHSSYAIRGGLWVVKSFDPVVLIGGLQYERVFSREFDRVSRLEPENTFGVQLGYAFAVNDDLSLSTTVSGVFVGRTEFSDAIIERHEEYKLRLAVTGRIGQGRYIEPSVTFRMNGPGTYVMFGVSFPFLVNP